MSNHEDHQSGVPGHIEGASDLYDVNDNNLNERGSSFSNLDEPISLDFTGAGQEEVSKSLQKKTGNPFSSGRASHKVSEKEERQEKRATRRSLRRGDRTTEEPTGTTKDEESITAKSAALKALEEEEETSRKQSLFSKSLFSGGGKQQTEEEKDLDKARKASRKMVAGGAIRIDLTPDSYKSIIALRNLKRRWVVGLVVLLVACAGGLLYIYSGYSSSQASLQSERDAHRALDEDIAGYSEINTLLNDRDKLQRIAYESAGTEIEWGNLIATIEQSVPLDTTLSSFDADAAESYDESNAVVLYVEFVAGSPESYANSLAAISSIEGVSAVDISGLNAIGDGRFAFSMVFTVDGDVYTNKYEQQSNGTPNGNENTDSTVEEDE